MIFLGVLIWMYSLLIIKPSKMIKLDDREVQYILYCKGQLTEKYPFKGSWHDSFKPMFIELYGWDPDKDNNLHSYYGILFRRLLGIYLKIQDDYLPTQLENIFEAAFHKRISNDSEEPIERAIQELCGLIQCTTVINEDGTKRFELNKE